MCYVTVISFYTSTITGLSVLVGILLIVVIASVADNIILIIYNRQYDYY